VVDLPGMLKALADPTRLRIIRLLSGREELCVCEIVDALGVPQYSVSRHLGVLKAAGLVVGRRQGRWMHYAVDPRLSDQERGIVGAVCARVERDAIARGDHRRLERSLRSRRRGGMLKCR